MSPRPRDAGYLLGLASAIDGLYRREYLAFTETLLWVTSGLLMTDIGRRGEPAHAFRAVLTELLPGLSNAYAGGFSEVDPRINVSLALVFDAMQYLQSTALDPPRLASLRRETADVIAELVLLIPDMNYYFEQPVRERISEEIDVCISIVADRDDEGRSTLSREQFEGCLDSLVGMAQRPGQPRRTGRRSGRPLRPRTAAPGADADALAANQLRAGLPERATSDRLPNACPAAAQPARVVEPGHPCGLVCQAVTGVFPDTAERSTGSSGCAGRAWSYWKPGRNRWTASARPAAV